MTDVFEHYNERRAQLQAVILQIMQQHGHIVVAEAADRILTEGLDVITEAMILEAAEDVTVEMFIELTAQHPLPTIVKETVPARRGFWDNLVDKLMNIIRR